MELAEISTHDEITALVERAWEVRTERFGDSTDMCSLVNAKSGGCAEDCGFCAQSRYAEADTPMHAMMEPEQILEHAKAAEAAGAHRFCMVTQGQGLSQARLREDRRGRAAGRREHQPEALRLDRPHLGRARQAAGRRGRPARPPQRRDRALLLPGGLHHGPLRGPHPHDRRRQGGGPRDAASAASSTSARRPASGWRWRSSWPRSTPPRCRSTCSTRGPGTKFGDRPLMDPWEVVKWVAIFRLILPGRPLPPLRRAGREPRRAPAAGRQGGPQRRDDGELPDHAGRRARRRPRDVRGPGAERGPPGRQRRQPAARQPLRLARRRDAAERRSRS